MSNYKILFTLYLLSFIVADPFKPLNTDFLKSTSPLPTIPKQKQPDKKNLPQYEKVIKDFKKFDGLFTMFWNEEKNQLLMEIKPEHFTMKFLANMTRTSGDGMYYDGGSMLWEYPYIIDQWGGDIRNIHINTLFRAEESSPVHKLVDRNFSNSIFATSKIVSSIFSPNVWF